MVVGYHHFRKPPYGIIIDHYKDPYEPTSNYNGSIGPGFSSWTPPWKIFPRQKNPICDLWDEENSELTKFETNSAGWNFQKGLRSYVLGWGKSSVRSVDEARWIFDDFLCNICSRWWKNLMIMYTGKVALWNDWSEEAFAAVLTKTLQYPHIGSNCIFFCARCRTKTAVVVKSSHTKPPQLPVLFAWKWKVRCKYKSREFPTKTIFLEWETKSEVCESMWVSQKLSPKDCGKNKKHCSRRITIAAMAPQKKSWLRCLFSGRDFWRWTAWFRWAAPDFGAGQAGRSNEFVEPPN